MSQHYLNRITGLMRHPISLVVWAVSTVLIYQFLDKKFAEYFYHVFSMKAPIILTAITILGKNSLIIGLLFLSVIFFSFVRYNRVWQAKSIWLSACVLIPNLIVGMIKVVVGRARPEEWLWYQKFGFYGWSIDPNFWSMPSGHTTTIVSLALGLTLCWPKHRYIWLISAVIVTISRVMLWKHYLSDVWVAWGLTLLILPIVLHFFQKTRYYKNL